MDANPEAVMQFVAEQLGVDRFTLNLQTTLYGDLQLYGDDCDDFLLAFARRFSVSLDGIVLSRYFPPEPYLGPRLLRMMARRLFWSSEPHAVAEVAPLRIADLVQWAVQGAVTQ